jgi:dihydropyrimidinase
VRGAAVIADGVLQVQPGFGQFLPRTVADPAHSGKPVEETTPWLDA